MSSLPPSGDGTGNSRVISPEVVIDVEGLSAPTARGQVRDSDIFNVWNYGFSVGHGFRCGFCGVTKQSRGATRLKMHEQMEWLNKPRVEDDDLSLEQMISRSKRRKIVGLQRDKRNKGKSIVEDEEDDLEYGSHTDESTPPGSPAYAESGDSSSSTKNNVHEID